MLVQQAGYLNFGLIGHVSPVPDCYGISPWAIFVRGDSKIERPEDLITLLVVAAGATPVPRTRSSHCNCRESGCELRVQSGTRIIALLVSFDSEVRIGRAARLGELRNRDTNKITPVFRFSEQARRKPGSAA